MKDFGGMVSFELKGTVEQAKIFAESTKIFLLAESLGGVESLLGYPWLMSHGCLTDEEKRAKGLLPTLLRLSVGIEDMEDILEDLKQALQLSNTTGTPPTLSPESRHPVKSNHAQTASPLPINCSCNLPRPPTDAAPCFASVDKTNRL